MNSRELHFLLLTGKLGDPDRNPLSSAQLRILAQRVQTASFSDLDGELTGKHLRELGLDEALSEKILTLLKDRIQLEAYVSRALKNNCFAVTRTSEEYPLIVRKRLGNEAPGCLWIRGNRDILKMPAVALVGSRDLSPRNREFAREVGIQAARQGFALVSGNARGADITAQNACLRSGGCVISVVADPLICHEPSKNLVYVSEEDYDAPFSAQRALHRNRTIHAWGQVTFVAQCSLERGGTWDGTARNLKNLWSPVFCFRDGSESSAELERMGASLVSVEDLRNFSDLNEAQSCFF